MKVSLKPFANAAVASLLCAYGAAAPGTDIAAPAATPATAVAAAAPAAFQPAGGMPPTLLPPVPERAVEQYAQAITLLKSGKMTDAELELKQLIVAYPDLPGPQINLGLLLLHAARLPEAQAAFKAALAINPSSAIANSELGIVERRMGKFTDAEQDYQRAISADPGYAPARLNLGILYDLYLFEPQKALDQFEQYLTLAGENKQVTGWVVELKKRLGVAAPAAAKKDPA